MFLKAKAVSGFTLIELLVVIAIIGLLSSIVLASLGTARSKAADAAIQANLVGVRSSAEIYYTDNGESYSADNTGVANDNDCFTFGVISLFTYPSIKSAMQQAFQQNGSITNSMFCGADKDTRSYAVAVGLKTQRDIPPQEQKITFVLIVPEQLKS